MEKLGAELGLSHHASFDACSYKDNDLDLLSLKDGSRLKAYPVKRLETSMSVQQHASDEDTPVNGSFEAYR